MILNVVTVCLNARDSIRLTLESIKSQKNAVIRHVVIDGGSSDDTLSIVKEYNPYYLCSEKDSGVYDAMDKASKAIDGDFVVYLNAGDVFYSDTTASEIIDAFTITNADIIFGNILPVYLRPRDTHDHTAFVSGTELNLSYVTSRHFLYDESIHHQATVYKTWVVKSCSYLSTQNTAATGEYNLLLNAVIIKGAIVKYVPITISRFALGGISTKSFDHEWKKYISARDALRSIYFPRGRSNAFLNRNEFVSFKLSRDAKIVSQRMVAKAILKRSVLFKVYNRIVRSIVSRIVNELKDEIRVVIHSEMAIYRAEITSEFTALSGRHSEMTDRVEFQNKGIGFRKSN